MSLEKHGWSLAGDVMDEKGDRAITRDDVLATAIVVVLISWAVVIVLLVAFWDWICAKIVLDALEYGIEQLPPPR